MVSLGLAVGIAFSYRIVTKLLVLTRISKRVKSIETTSICIWGLGAIVTAILIQDQYVFQVPVVDTNVFILAAIIMLVNTVLSHFVYCQPTGSTNIFFGAVVFPLLQEVVFRGLLLPVLNPSFGFVVIEMFEVQVSLSVLVSALLFAFAQLQYDQSKGISVSKLSIVFIVGALFGVIADSTQSIFIPVLLHIEYKLLANYYSNREKVE
ncbi:CPBP family glutamic-type intramembrane protease [Paenibacillus xylaniclasticus]|uniref:CPBP family glutamic-type intramembrane protease n=1 Tax=Paenibacillus xylaniclasticus TaxID=588083 RepID=UPI001FE25F0F|nr:MULTISPECIES: CPBP family intramembrane glutamic endopeptidase [Paenibacillus]